jgi:hypothetical protein
LQGAVAGRVGAAVVVRSVLALFWWALVARRGV